MTTTEWNLVLAAIVTVLVLYAVGGLWLRQALRNAPPDPEDERATVKRMAKLRAEAEREGRYVRLEDWQ